jgi:hypothetical protein
MHFRLNNQNYLSFIVLAVLSACAQDPYQGSIFEENVHNGQNYQSDAGSDSGYLDDLIEEEIIEEVIIKAEGELCLDSDECAQGHVCLANAMLSVDDQQKRCTSACTTFEASCPIAYHCVELFGFMQDQVLDEYVLYPEGGYAYAHEMNSRGLYCMPRPAYNSLWRLTILSAEVSRFNPETGNSWDSAGRFEAPDPQICYGLTAPTACLAAHEEDTYVPYWDRQLGVYTFEELGNLFFEMIDDDWWGSESMGDVFTLNLQPSVLMHARNRQMLIISDDRLPEAILRMTFIVQPFDR